MIEVEVEAVGLAAGVVEGQADRHPGFVVGFEAQAAGSAALVAPADLVFDLELAYTNLCFQPPHVPRTL